MKAPEVLVITVRVCRGQSFVFAEIRAKAHLV